MSKSKINVIKVPNETVNQPPKAMEFPRMPRMYLELIENKEKIKPTLVNKEYDPDEVATVTSESRRPKNFNQQDDDDNDYEDDDNIEIELDNQEDGDEDFEEGNDGEDSDIKDIEDAEDAEDAEDEEDAKDAEDTKDEEDLVDQEEDEDDEEDANEAGDFRVPPPRGRDRNFMDDNESLVEDDENDENDQEDERSKNGLPVFPPFGGNRNLRENMKMPNYNNDENESVHSGQSRKSIRLTREESIKKNQVREKLKEILRDPPKLSELEQRGEVKTKRTIPNMVGGKSIEEEDELKRELLYKFELVKRSYKNVDIPEFNMHSDYKNMNRTYENTLRRVSLDSNVDTYRNYLIAGFMLMEYILGYWLKFDMAGFTQQQILNMNQYERLLIELGEKSYVPDSKKWPVEVRLLGMIILNAVIFIVAKMIMTKTGTSLFGLMNAQQSEFQKNKPKRKMKGPNIDLSSIPDIDEQSA